MRTKKAFLVQRLFLVLAALLLAPSITIAQLGLNQDRISESEWSRGFHGFNMIAKGNGLERISLDEFTSAEPADVCLVVIGKLRNLPVNVSNHVSAGGAAMVASDSNRPFNSASFAGFQFAALRSFPTRDADAFGGMADCPLVRDFEDHPVVADVTAIVTNRPGYVASDRTATLARLPSTYRRRGNPMSFIGANELRNGGRMVAVGDQSIFTNQMLIYGHNARLANQAITWLQGGKRNRILLLVDGKEYLALDPADVVVDLPPPSHEEVFDALSDLPPSAMLEFANSVATVVEDENMINDFIHDSVDNIPQSAFNRFYLFLMLVVACLSFIFAFAFQRKLQRQTASEIAFERSSREQTDLKSIQFRERQQAALFLLDKFCIDIAGKRIAYWPSFPTELNFGEDRESKNIFESMRKMSILYKSKPTDFWTRKKLATLESEVGRWRKYFNTRPAFSNAEVWEGLTNEGTLH